MHAGILTGGGDCPGLNAVIRATALGLIRGGARVSGIDKGFHGLVARGARPLTAGDVQGILAEGGTVLGTHNRCDPFNWQGRDQSEVALAYARELGLDALVVVGGDGTMGIAHRIHQLGLPVVGVPKTIDNDLPDTDRTFGFDSAVAVVAESLDRVATTARSHGRVMIVETMGRYTGWIALEGGLAGGADAILIPELNAPLPELLAAVRRRAAAGEPMLICVAEGVKLHDGGYSVREHIADSPDPLRLGGVGAALQAWLTEQGVDCEVRSLQLGHLQRGGTPTAFDRVLSTRYGYHAAELVATGRHGRMVALKGETVTDVDLAQVAGRTRPVPTDHELVRAARGTGVLMGTASAA